MNFQFEMTDTFAGEANYSWVKRKSFDFKSTATDKALVRRAKKWAGITGVRCKVDVYDSVIAIKPCKWPVVVFVSEGIM
jgi:hypothetical protein